MRKLHLIVHVSLDGYIAGPKGELDAFDAGDENLQFVCDLTEQADAALFGRNSYELLNGAWPTKLNQPHATIAEIAFSKWYNAAHKIIVSQTLPEPLIPNTTVIRENFSAVIAQMKQQKAKDILLFGSPGLARLLLPTGLIDSIWIFINPVIFGAGIPLFPVLSGRMKLELIATKIFANGELALHYTPALGKDTRLTTF